MDVQLALGADIVMAFDQCLPTAPDRPRSSAPSIAPRAGCTAVATLQGRRRHDGWERVLFGIVQGGCTPQLRRRSAAENRSNWTCRATRSAACRWGSRRGHARDAERAARLLPADRPRYLMGVGLPDDILAAVAGGMDMFDCVLPTRIGPPGTVLTRDGRLVVKNQEYAEDERPLDPECGCPVCARHTRAYLRHLFQAHEMLGPTLATIHNLHFYQELMQGIRAAVEQERFGAFAAAASGRWRDGEAARLDAVRRRSG